MRFGVISELKLTGIDWRGNAINAFQGKNSQASQAPLDAAAGYRFNERPQGKNAECMFISSRAPHTKLAGGKLMKKRLEKAGLCEGESGFHALGRGIAADLLEAGADHEIVSQIDGHMRLESLDPYFAVDIEGLRKRRRASFEDLGAPASSWGAKP
ncbi:MAG: tyrosine-type recombinase/integrase [Clostridiales bacterium]|nr:tyrosine-type recombinase/integrase [Clostridiales bacterium]